MKLVLISDTHTKHDKVNLPDGDILIHCGDLTSKGDFIELSSAIGWLKGITMRYKKILFIGGNHDFGLQNSAYKRSLLNALPDNCIYLQDKGIQIDSLYFYGTPWTPVFYNWAFMLPDIDLASKFKKIPKKTNVLISHGPPSNILDKNKEGDHCGSESLYLRVKELPNLKLHCFGHIHEARGIEYIDNTKFINCSVLNRQYQVVNKPFIVEI